MTQQALADLVSVNRVTYKNWENGKREPELNKVVELATELNSTVDYLLGNSDINYLDILVSNFFDWLLVFCLDHLFHSFNFLIHKKTVSVICSSLIPFQ
ncbi:helix-turn-helix transcriptional regulator [Listeria goaensis]|uniref:helix-turn-helix transcriptional regulator n=1 Tax=Listeria goaensis TaxID=1649188 RepID=UPI000B589429|nr:helix-turn-helix transcriptional regulator [Listeria goaensis]